MLKRVLYFCWEGGFLRFTLNRGRETVSDKTKNTRIFVPSLDLYGVAVLVALASHEATTVNGGIPPPKSPPAPSGHPRGQCHSG